MNKHSIAYAFGSAVIIAGVCIFYNRGVLAADTNYAPPDPKFLTQVETIASSIKAAPTAKPREALAYEISFGPHRFSIRTAQQVSILLGEKPGLTKRSSATIWPILKRTNSSNSTR